MPSNIPRLSSQPATRTPRLIVQKDGREPEGHRPQSLRLGKGYHYALTILLTSARLPGEPGRAFGCAE